MSWENILKQNPLNELKEKIDDLIDEMKPLFASDPEDWDYTFDISVVLGVDEEDVDAYFNIPNLGNATYVIGTKNQTPNILEKLRELYEPHTKVVVNSIDKITLYPPWKMSGDR